MMTKRANQRGVIVVAHYGFGPIWVPWPYDDFFIGVRIGEKVHGHTKLSRTPKWYPIDTSVTRIEVVLGKHPSIDVTRPGLDFSKGLVLFAEGHRTNGKAGKAILVQNSLSDQ